jgi:lipopolysaccharide exporter
MKARSGLGSAMTVGLGTMIGQGSLLLVSPVLTRIYGPQVFGVYSVFVAYVALLSTTSAFHFELAIPLPRSRSEAGLLVRLAMICVGFTAMFFAVILEMIPSVTPRSITEFEKNIFVMTAASALFLSGVNVVLSAWAIREKQFSGLAFSKAGQGVIQALFQGGIGALFSSVWTLVAGQMLGLLCCGLVLLNSSKFPTKVESTESALSSIKKLAKRYRNFAFFSTSSSLINAAASNIPVLFIAAIHGTTSAGFYALSYRILQIPIRLVGQSIAQVFLSSAIESKNAGTLSSGTLSLFRGLVAFSVPSFVVLMIISPALFAVVFGDDWRKAGVYARYMSPWMFVTLISTVLSILVSVMERQRQETAIQVLYLLATMISLGFGWLEESVIVTLALLGLSGTLVLGGKILWLMHLSGAGVRASVKIVLREVFLFSPVYIGLMFAEQHDMNAVLFVCIGVFATFVIQFLNYFYRPIYRDVLGRTGD